jgi:hypothetical protein
MHVTSSTFPEIFKLDELNSILPFKADNPLHEAVQSDHTEIALKTPEARIINVWNISNPAYHGYYKFGTNPPFYQTHMYVEKPYLENGELEASLANKIEDQLNMIANRFIKGEVSIQVIVEGYEEFYEQLIKKFQESNFTNYAICSLLNYKPEGWKKKSNVTAILVNTLFFKVLESNVVLKKYFEEEDSNKEKDFQMPFVKVSDELSNHQIFIIGVHINGCASQYPKSGLEVLAKEIQAFWKKGEEQADIIALGDFNTVPKNAKLSLLGNLNDQGILLNAPYPTHVNPHSMAGNYDQAIIMKSTELRKYEILTSDALSLASQKLIESIWKSYTKQADSQKLNF